MPVIRSCVICNIFTFGCNSRNFIRDVRWRVPPWRHGPWHLHSSPRERGVAPRSHHLSVRYITRSDTNVKISPIHPSRAHTWLHNVAESVPKTLSLFAQMRDYVIPRLSLCLLSGRTLERSREKSVSGRDSRLFGLLARRCFRWCESGRGRGAAEMSLVIGWDLPCHGRLSRNAL